VADLGQLGGALRVSALYETDPVGPPQPSYLNAAVRLEAPGEPRALLVSLLDVERRYGRVRREKWGPRILDLDILWIDGVSLTEPDLVVPHAALRERRFALAPLLDVAPEARDPVTGEAFADWLRALPEVGIQRIAEAGWEHAKGAFLPP
jgi:2-amino-4-hydroxy-6-hydroxymethyldihydropteridine diphosphokinase